MAYGIISQIARLSGYSSAFQAARLGMYLGDEFNKYVSYTNKTQHPAALSLALEKDIDREYAKTHYTQQGVVGRGRTRAKRSFKRRGSGKSSYARKARIVPGYTRTGGFYGKYNRGDSGAELKFFDTAQSWSFGTTMIIPTNGQLTLIPQGDTQSTRDGRRAFIRSVQLRGALDYNPGSNGYAAVHCFLYLVLDTQCNGAAAGATDVFTSATAHTSLMNLNNSGRFKIMKKWIFYMEPQAGTTTAFNACRRQIEFFQRCNIKVDWSSTTGAISEIRSNNLFLLAGSDNANGLVAFSGNCRLRFQS